MTDHPPRSAGLRLLGLDPGLRVTGWGVIEVSGSHLRWLADGVVRSDGDAPLSDRLAQLHRGICAVIAAWTPDEAAIEQTFVNMNPESTLKLGQARGAVITAAALSGLPVGEYAPAAVKQAVVGTGRAAKQQIDLMVRHLLPGCVAETADAADALAVAICHAHLRGQARRLAQALEKAR